MSQASKLKMKWSRQEDDFVYDYPRSCDGRLLHNFMNGEVNWKDFLDELTKRGYDTKTLKFEVVRTSE